MRNSRRPIAVAVVILLGLLASLQQWLTDRRPVSPLLGSKQDFVVTSSADAGPGSLREAIFAADSASERARIRIQASRIVLQSPLPPLVNPLGVIVEGGDVHPEIDASGIGTGPVFDVAAPNSAITGLTITNAPEQALLVRTDGLRVARARIAHSDVGLYIADGVNEVVAEDASFDNNRIGIWVSPNGRGIILRNNRFAAHEDAAVWAVGARRDRALQSGRVELHGNRFEGDRLSVVLGNVPAIIENNEFVQAREAAVYLMGEGAIVRNNRIRNGAGIGVFADAAHGAVIEGNELDHNRALAVLVRSSRNARVENNRIYDNGYGIAFVLGEPQGPSTAIGNTLLSQQFDGLILIGDSPIIQGNRLVDNRLAALRILDYFPLRGTPVPSNPFLARNTVSGNKLNDPVRGEYRVRKQE